MKVARLKRYQRTRAFNISIQ